MATPTRHQFAHDVLLDVAGVSGLEYLGPLWAIMGWTIAESGSHPCNGQPNMGARFNPLNTTLVLPGSTAYNSIGVQNYTSYDQGVQATVSTLRETPYAKVVAALGKAGQYDRAALALWEVVGSPWGTTGRDAYNGLADFLADKSFFNMLTVG